MGFFHSLLLIGAKPKNALEETLMAFLKGRCDLPEWIAALKKSRVTVLVKDPPQAGAETGQQMRPLVLDGADGRPALCVFTHPCRALPLQKRVPAYGYALETEFSAVLGFTPAGFGMQFNPGSFFSTEVLPEGVDELR